MRLIIRRQFNASTLQPPPAMRKKRSTITYLLSTIALLTLAAASGQTSVPIPEGRFPEPLEKPGMPPAPPGTYRLESSPRMISPYDGFVSYQANVDSNGNNIVGDAANEPSISVDPTNG